MRAEEALELIKKRRRNVKSIVREIGGTALLKELLNNDEFMDIALDYALKHSKEPEAELIISAFKELCKEKTAKDEAVSEFLRREEENARITHEALVRYARSYRKDPLADLLIRKLSLTPLKAGMLGFALTFITYAVGFALYAILKKPIAGITAVSMDLIYDFSLVPIVFGFYVWAAPKAGYLFLELKKRGVRFEREGEFDAFAEYSCKKVINSRACIALSGAVTAFLAVLTIYSAATFDTRWGPRHSNFILFCAWKVPVLWGLSWYMAFMTFLRGITTAVSLKRLMKKGPAINILHMDRQGGLKPISDYAMTFAYFVMACGYAFALLFIRSWKYAYWRDDIIVDIGFVIYLALASYIFFLPLLPAESVVKKTRQELAFEVSREFNIVPILRPAFVLRFAVITLMPIFTLLGFPALKSFISLE